MSVCNISDKLGFFFSLVYSVSLLAVAFAFVELVLLVDDGDDNGGPITKASIAASTNESILVELLSEDGASLALLVPLSFNRSMAAFSASALSPPPSFPTLVVSSLSINVEADDEKW